jgi:AraC family ethanolamine operon transcriptional activator
MFLFDNKTNILIESNEITFKSEYYCDFFDFCKMREFLEIDALQLSGSHFEGYISKLITDQVMLELSQRNCLNKQEGLIHANMWLFGIPVQAKRVFFQNLYQVENNYIGIIPPKKEFELLQTPFSHRFQLYVHEDYLNQSCQTLDLPEAKNFLNYSQCSILTCSPEKIRSLQQSCHQLYQLSFDLESQQIALHRKAISLKFIKKQLKKEIVKNFLLTLAEAQDVKPKKNTIRRTSILKQTEEMMKNSLYSDLTTSDICQALEVSQRTLEYVFKDFYQISPKQYFKQLRLNALHQSLHQDIQRPFIYEVAEKLGFFHRGQLAGDYQKLFGKLPSEIF